MPDRRIPSSFHKGWLIAWLVSMGVVLTLTHIPQDAMPEFLNEHMLDKLEHVLAYGLIAFLFLLSLPEGSRPATFVIGLVGLAVIGAVDEITQPFVNRIASVGDYAADVMGILLACVIFLVKRRFRFDTTAL
jgi:VanZ family protein